MALGLLLTGLPVHADEDVGLPWYQIANTHFEVYSDAPQQEIRLLLDDLERFRVAVEQFNGASVPQKSEKTRVIIFRSKQDYVKHVDNDWVEAFTAGREGVPHIVMWADRMSPASQATIRHEFVHVLQGYSGQLLPLWYLEGSAEFMSGISFSDENTQFVIGAATERAVSRRSFVDWSRLIDDDFRFEAVESGKAVSNAYYQAGLLARYFQIGDDFAHRDRLQEYLARYADGEASPQAFEAAFGEAVNDLATRAFKERRKRIKPKAFPFVAQACDHEFTVSATTPNAVFDMLAALEAGTAQ